MKLEDHNPEHCAGCSAIIRKLKRANSILRTALYDVRRPDPRVGKLTSEDAEMLKRVAEEIGALDCMPAWMRAEIEAKTKPPNDPDQLRLPDQNSQRQNEL